MSEYRSVPLAEAVVLQRGFDLPVGNRRTGEVPVVASTSIVGFHDESAVEGPGVVIGRSGSIGGGQWIDSDFWPLNTTLWVKDFKGNDPRFIYFLLRSIDFSPFNAGSGVPTLNRNHLSAIEVVIPPLPEQRAIAEVLGALDDKIESNRRVQSLIAAYSDVAWRRMTEAGEGVTCELEAIVKFNGRTIRPGDPADSILYVDISSVKPDEIGDVREISWAEAPSRARRSVVDGDMIFSTVRPERRSFALLLDPEPNTVVSTGFATLTPSGVGPAFLHAVLSDTSFSDYCQSAAQGTAYPAIKPDAMGKYPVVLPNPDRLDVFEEEVMPMLRLSASLASESRSLAQLRDTLLPALLSGRIRVPAAAELVEAR